MKIALFRKYQSLRNNITIHFHYRDILASIDAKNDNQNAHNKYIYTHRKCGKNLS
jgi:hypothetical protein